MNKMNNFNNMQDSIFLSTPSQKNVNLCIPDG